MALPKNTLTLKVSRPGEVTPLDGTWKIRIATVDGVAVNAATGEGMAGTWEQDTVAGLATFELPDNTDADFEPLGGMYVASFSSLERVPGSPNTSAVRFTSNPFDMEADKTFADIKAAIAGPVDSSVVAQALAALAQMEVLLEDADLNSVASIKALGPFLAAANTAATTPVRVVFLGSSTTAGSNATTADKRWVNLLSARLQAAYPSGGAESAVASLGAGFPTENETPGIQVYNGGAAFANSGTYTNSTTMPFVRWRDPALVVHMIGSNDSVLDTPLETYRANVEARIVDIDATRNPTSHVLVHTYRRSEATGPEWEAYGDVLAAIAEERENVAFVDISGAYEVLDHLGADPFGVIDTDAVHQTDAGHALMADLVARALGVSAASSGGGGAVASVNGDTGVVVLNAADVGADAAGAAAAAQAAAIQRANHTGTQAQSTITNLTTDLAAKAPTASPTFTGTVSGVTKTHVGLGNVDNTADSAKPVSTAQAAADTAVQAAAIQRANHTGTQAISTVTNLQTTLDAKALAAGVSVLMLYNGTTGWVDPRTGSVVNEASGRPSMNGGFVQLAGHTSAVSEPTWFINGDSALVTG